MKHINHNNVIAIYRNRCCKLLFKYVYLYLYSNLDSNKMIAVNFTEFRTNLKKFLDSVENDNEILIIKRGSGKGAVMISLDEYNSIMETVHLLSSKANADWIYESVRQMKQGDGAHRKLIEE